MKATTLALALVATLALPHAAFAAKFTYHGQMMDGERPANGLYDLKVRAYSSADRTTALGAATEIPGVRFVEGQFNVELELPQGADGETYVDVAVRAKSQGAAYESLGAPQLVTSVALACPGSWAIDGNFGNPANSFLGTVDNQALILKSRGFTGLRLEPFDLSGTHYMNVIGGRFNNYIGPNVFSATISGGGSDDDNFRNSAYGSYGTIGGGANNDVGNPFVGLSTVVYATVGGGGGNKARAAYSTIPGGFGNIASGDYSFAAGINSLVQAFHHRSFVWSDSDAQFATSGPNQFLVNSSNGVGINGRPPNTDTEFTVHGVADDAFGGFVEFRMTPSIGNVSGEGIELGVGKGGAGSNDADFRIVQRSESPAAFVPVLMISSTGITSVKNGTVGNLSDARLKKNIGDIEKPLDTLLALRGHVFEYLDPAKAMNDPGPRMGFVAQEVQSTLPSWVKPTDEGYLSVSTIGFEALAVEAIRDLKAESDVRIEQLESENQALRRQMSDLLQRFERLQSERAE